MNAIRQTQLLNKRELENATPPSASWHVDYRDTAWIYIGGIPLDLSEGDVITVFSQYGEPTHLNLIRDRETGKSKGFAFLRYADQRSCDLAVDNLGGAELLGRILRVDHTRYKKRDGENDDTWKIVRLEAAAQKDPRIGNSKRLSDTEGESDAEKDRKKRRRVIKGEKERNKRYAIKSEDTEDEDDASSIDRTFSKRKESRGGRYDYDQVRRSAQKHRDHSRDDRTGRQRELPSYDDNNEGSSKRHRYKHPSSDTVISSRHADQHSGGERDHRGRFEPFDSPRSALSRSPEQRSRRRHYNSGEDEDRPKPKQDRE